MTINDELYDVIDAQVYCIADSTLGIQTAADECEVIVEDVSCRFAEWLNENTWMDSPSYRIAHNNEVTSAKELFELFKKENNL